MSSFHPPFITTALIILAVVLMTKILPSPTPSATSSSTLPENTSPTPTPTPSPSPTPIPTMSPTQMIIKTPNPTSSQKNTSLSDFIYPNSKQISNSYNSLSLESQDSPQVITNWYKDKIKSLGMSTTSFVQTSTNDNVLNKLVGSSGNQQVRVEISKKQSETKVKIIVESLP